MNVEIKNAEKQDIEQMIALLEILFSIEEDFQFDPLKHQKALEHIVMNQDCGCLVAVKDSEVLGMCTAQWVYSTATGKKSAWMEDLIVLPEYQGAGLGKKLLKAIQNWAIQEGCNRMQLVYDLNNTPAIEFYEKQEFNKTQLGVFSKPI